MPSSAPFNSETSGEGTRVVSQGRAPVPAAAASALVPGMRRQTVVGLSTLDHDPGGYTGLGINQLHTSGGSFGRARGPMWPGALAVSGLNGSGDGHRFEERRRSRTTDDTEPRRLPAQLRARIAQQAARAKATTSPKNYPLENNDSNGESKVDSISARGAMEAAEALTRALQSPIMDSRSGSGGRRTAGKQGGAGDSPAVRSWWAALAKAPSQLSLRSGIGGAGTDANHYAKSAQQESR